MCKAILPDILRIEPTDHPLDVNWQLVLLRSAKKRDWKVLEKLFPNRTKTIMARFGIKF